MQFAPPHTFHSQLGRYRMSLTMDADNGQEIFEMT
jgi:hypothetical protein